MKRSRRSTINYLQTVLLAPVVAAVVTFGLWLAAASTYESAKFVKVTDRILDVLSLSKSMSVDENVNLTFVFDFLKKRNAELVGKSAINEYGGITNPWGGVIDVTAQLGGILRFDVTVPPAACRRLAIFYGNDAPGLGLRKVEVRENSPKAIWRQVYSAPDGKDGAGIEPMAATAGCGNENDVSVALTFRLK